MEKIYIFHLRYIGRAQRNWPIESWYETIDMLSDSYEDALINAKKQFRRMYNYLDTIDNEDIEVIDWELG